MDNLEKAVDDYCKTLTRGLSLTDTIVGIFVIGLKNNKVVSKTFRNL